MRALGRSSFSVPLTELLLQLYDILARDLFININSQNICLHSDHALCMGLAFDGLRVNGVIDRIDEVLPVVDCVVCVNTASVRHQADHNAH